MDEAKLQIKKFVPGILFCFILAIPALILGHLFPIIGGPVFGIIIGMLATLLSPKFTSVTLINERVGVIKKRYPFDPGIKYTSKKLLQYAIILLGFSMNLFKVIQVGSQSLLIIFFTLSAAFITAFFVGKLLKIHAKMSTLIGVGTSICGGSAIAATAPVIQAKDEDVAHAISTIFLFNIIAVFIFPLFGHLLHMSNTGFGMWAGTAINDTSSVVAAATSWSVSSGNNTALVFATIVKLTRTLMIVPITLFLAWYTMHTTKKDKPGASNFHFAKVFPWFIVWFLGVSVLNTFFFVPAILQHWLVVFGQFLIIMAMVAIGSATHIKKLIFNGFKPIFLGLCCWFAVASVSLLIQFFMRGW